MLWPNQVKSPAYPYLQLNTSSYDGLDVIGLLLKLGIVFFSHQHLVWKNRSCVCLQNILLHNLRNVLRVIESTRTL